MLHVKLKILVSTVLDFEPGRAAYVEGERYDVRQDIAAELVRSGAAEPLAVDEQRADDGHVATPEERAACLELMHTLKPEAAAIAAIASAVAVEAPPPAKE